jgi:hypothetical protein
VEKLAISATLREATKQSEIQRARMSDEASVHAAGLGNPWINLSDGHELITPYSGPAELTQILERNEARPLSLCSADFDEDGVPDLISGYAGPNGGIVTLLRGNVDSIYPNAPEAQQRRAEGTFTVAPFLSPALVFAVPEAADFIGAGDFDGDGHWDVVAAAHSGVVLHLPSGDGKGGLRPTKHIELPGGVTAMAVGEINRRDGLDGVVVGVSSEQGSKVLVFEGPEGAVKATPEEFDMQAEVTYLSLGQLDASYEQDLMIATGNKLVVVWGRDRRLSLDERKQAEVQRASISSRSFSVAVRSISSGNFNLDQNKYFGLLLEDGAVIALSDVDSTGGKPNRKINRWRKETLAGGTSGGLGHLVCARASSAAADNLVLVNRAERTIEILRVDRETSAEETSSAASGFKRLAAKFDADPAPLVVLPMRLDADALSDLVVLRANTERPAVMLSAQNDIEGGDVSAQAMTFTNQALINIGFSSIASPYPSTIDVTGLTGAVTKVTARLNNLSHSFPEDIDILLVSPSGQTLKLMSDCGGGVAVNSITLTFDDAAPNFLEGVIVSGTFKPTDFNIGTDVFPSPAPPPPYAATLSTFNGFSPNGLWSLYVVDGFPEEDGGSIAGGWSLSIDTSQTTLTVTNTNDDGAGSLRQAIRDANSRAGADTISFNIQPPGPKTITLQSVLPTVTEAVTIDGTTQPGYTTVPIISLRRGAPGSTLKISGGNSTIRGLDICSVTNGRNFVIDEPPYIDLEIATGGANRIEGNVISEAGVFVTSSSNTIGGSTDAATNSFAANKLASNLFLYGQAATNNQIQGNFFSAKPDSCLPSVNCSNPYGFCVRLSGASNNLIGGTTPLARQRDCWVALRLAPFD